MAGLFGCGNNVNEFFELQNSGVFYDFATQDANSGKRMVRLDVAY
jgi:hypothetical protein